MIKLFRASVAPITVLSIFQNVRTTLITKELKVIITEFYAKKVIIL
jgi:hypothetical protein